MNHLRSTLLARLPDGTMTRVRIVALALSSLFLLTTVPYAIFATSEPRALRAVLVAIIVTVIVLWWSWFAGRPVRHASLALEAVMIALAVNVIEQQTLYILIFYAGICVRPYFSSARSVATAVAVYSVALFAGIGYVRSDGFSLLSSDILIQPLLLAMTGGIAHFIALNIDRQQDLLETLASNESRYRSLVERVPGVIITSSSDGVIRFASPQFEPMFGALLPAERPTWMESVLRYVHPDDRVRTLDIARNAYRAGTPFALECRAYLANGELGWMRLEAVLVNDGSPEAPYWQSIITDITERHQLTAQLAHQALHDALTGLPNRKLFHDRVEHALALAHRSGAMTAVAFLDLDNFKLVNDSLGHAVGDHLIVDVGKRLAACVRPGDTVARLGGDEFGMLFESLQGMDAVTAITARISEQLSLPFELSGHEIHTTASIGVANARGRKLTAAELIRHADVAMYEAKHGGKSRTVAFEASMDERAWQRMELETELRRAVELEEFVVVYQPIVDLESGAIREIEALVRWQHPTRGLVSPGIFLPIADRTGLIIPIGRWVLREACQHAVAWQRAAPEHAELIVSVNISARQLRSEELVTDVTAMLASSGLAARHLQLEVTESAILVDIAHTVATLARLSALGVRLAIDDFGAGNSSFAHLRDLPMQTLKIDRSFIANMDASNHGSSILRSMISLAKALGMEVTAEGIETSEQARVSELGCDYGQGYYFTHPVSGAEISQLLSTGLSYDVTLNGLAGASANQPVLPGAHNTAWNAAPHGLDADASSEE